MKQVLVFLLLVMSLHSGAQQVMWKRFNNQNGLHAASIICITQTRDGILWLGTQDGLIAFNGNRFTDIPIGTSKPYVEGITADPMGRLWLGCRDGLRIYTPASQTWQTFTTHPNLGEKINGVVPSYDTQFVYLITDKGLLKAKTTNPQAIEIIDPRVFEQVGCDPNRVWGHTRNSLVIWQHNRKQTVMANTPVFDCQRIPGEQRLLAATAKGFFWINPNLSLEPATVNAPVNLSKLGTLHVIFPEPNGRRIWIKQYDTVFCLNGLSDPNPEIHCWNHLNPYSIPQQVIQLYADSYHNMWVLSGGDGLGLLPARTRSLRFVPSELAQTSTIWNVLEDTQTQQTVYCTQQSVSILNLQTGNLKKLKPPIPNNRFTCSQIVDYNQQFWMVGTYGAGVWLLDKYTHQYKRLPGFIQAVNINAIYKLKPDSFLFLATGGVFSYSFTHPSTKRIWSEIKSNVLSIARIPGKGYWLGFDGGICEVDVEGKQVIRQFKHNPLDSNSIRDNVVFSLYLNQQGDVFCATSNGGLNWMHKSTLQFTQLPLQQNPANIYGIIEVSSDSILFLGGEGIYLYLPNQQRSLLLNRENGLHIGAFAQFGYSFNGEAIYCSGGEGAVRLERSQLPALFSDSLSVDIIGPYVQNKHVHIPAGLQQLQLEIVNANKGALSTIKYSYYLTNLDQEWHEVNSTHEINYPYIPPGDYVLHIRAVDANGIIPTQTTLLTVSVLPLWFQTGWFFALMICATLVVLILAVRYFSYLRLQWNLKALEAKQKVAEERLRISRELHDNVGSQLTYLITGLEASEVMLEQQHTQKLSTNLEQLQASARDSMQQLRDAIWALNKEEMTLQLLSDRFKSWTLRMFDNQPTDVSFEMDIQHNFQLDAVATLSIFRLLQEAIHNCIKHAQASHIRITIVAQSDNCSLSITDNGKGFSGKGEGSGLSNMQSRAQQIGAQLTIHSQVNQGTTVTLTFQNRQ